MSEKATVEGRTKLEGKTTKYARVMVDAQVAATRGEVLLLLLETVEDAAEEYFQDVVKSAQGGAEAEGEGGGDSNGGGIRRGEDGREGD